MMWIEQTGWLSLPLIALSIIGLTLIIERSIYYIKLPKVTDSKLLKDLTATLDNIKSKSKPLRDETISQLLTDAKDPYFFGVRLLRLIAVISPMLGLLGTVLGIIKAFKVIAATNTPVSPALIADGLWTAMLTTAFGLCIALPCLFAAFIFARKGEKRITAYEKILNHRSLSFEGIKLT